MKKRGKAALRFLAQRCCACSVNSINAIFGENKSISLRCESRKTDARHINGFIAGAGFAYGIITVKPIDYYGLDAALLLILQNKNSIFSDEPQGN